MCFHWDVWYKRTEKIDYLCTKSLWDSLLCRECKDLVNCLRCCCTVGYAPVIYAIKVSFMSCLFLDSSVFCIKFRSFHYLAVFLLISCQKPLSTWLCYFPTVSSQIPSGSNLSITIWPKPLRYHLLLGRILITLTLLICVLVHLTTGQVPHRSE